MEPAAELGVMTKTEVLSVRVIVMILELLVRVEVQLESLVVDGVELEAPADVVVVEENIEVVLPLESDALESEVLELVVVTDELVDVSGVDVFFSLLDSVVAELVKVMDVLVAGDGVVDISSPLELDVLESNVLESNVLGSDALIVAMVVADDGIRVGSSLLDSTVVEFVGDMMDVFVVGDGVIDPVSLPESNVLELGVVELEVVVSVVVVVEDGVGVISLVELSSMVSDVPESMGVVNAFVAEDDVIVV